MNIFTVIHVFHNNAKHQDRKIKSIREELRKIADDRKIPAIHFTDTYLTHTIFATKKDLETVRKACLVGLTKDDILIVLPRSTESGEPYIYPHSLALKLQPLLPTFYQTDVIPILNEIRAFSGNHLC